MTLPAHVVGGYCLTGFISSMMFSINISQSWKMVVVCIIGSLLPDIDNPKALIAKPIYPISKFIYSRYGHRTITHSVPTFILISIFGAFAERAFLGEVTYTYILVSAMFVHSLLDSFTVMGVAMLFPISDKTVWLIENPKWQFRTADLKIEFTFIAVFIALIFVQGDLWKNGFWTSYNQAFSSPTHLLSEFQKADDVLQVEYSTKVGTEKVTGKGLVITCDENQVIVLENEKFRIIGADVEMILKTKPIHTGMQMKFEDLFFNSISIDSLNQLVRNQKLWEVEVEANREFRTKFGESKKLKYKMVTQLEFTEVEKFIELEEFEKKKNPRIDNLRMKVLQMQKKFARNKKRYLDQLTKKAKLKDDFLNESDFLKRNDLKRRHDDFKVMSEPKDISFEIAEMKAEIRELRIENVQENRIREKEVKANNESKRIGKLKVSGRLKIINLQKRTKKDTFNET